MKDFKLEIRNIKDDDKITYYACLTYVGKYREFINAIEQVKEETYFYEDDEAPAYKQYDLCLFNVMLTVEDRKIKGTYIVNRNEEDEDSEEFDKIKYSMHSNCHLYSFYNNTIKYDLLQNFEQSKKLKGIGYMILCSILKHIVSTNILSDDKLITLQASGEIPEKGMIGLVKYYESMGFRQVFPSLLEEGVEQADVPMRTNISNIIERCSSVEKSNEVKELERIIRHTYFNL
jgi:hypothetical protein